MTTPADDLSLRLAEELERYLGDPHDSAGSMPFARILELDEREEYPHEHVGMLMRFGVHRYCLPAEWGDLAGDVEVGFNLIRLVARRDPTLATALMITNIAFLPVWGVGTDEQGRRFVAEVNHGVRIAWGLSEREHGSDLLANQTRAVRTDGGYLLTGEKYLIGNATLADIVMVIARTSERGGPGGWSIFALDKRAQPAGLVVVLPNERLHGLRGLDMSGIRFADAFVPDSNRIGAEGHGLEIALQGAQVARIVITGLAIGAMDTALRVTCDFAVQRRIFGKTVAEIPYSRRQLAECFADLLLAETVTVAATRGLQANPTQASVFSAIAKYFTPTLLERSAAQLSVVLGARAYLRANPHYGIYQKMLRDLGVSIFAEGNTLVNLKSVAAQLEQLVDGALDADDEAVDAARRVVAVVYGRTAPLPPLRPATLTLFGRGRDEQVLLLADAVGALRTLADEHADADERRWYHRCADLAGGFSAELVRLRGELRDLRGQRGRDTGSSPELMRLTEQYCAIHAAAGVVQVALASDTLIEPFPNAAVTLLMLERAWRLLYPAESRTDERVIERAAGILFGLHSGGRLFSQRHTQLQTSHERAHL